MRICSRWETSTSEGVVVAVVAVCACDVEKTWSCKSMDCGTKGTSGNESAAFGLRSELEGRTVSAADDRLVGGEDETPKSKYTVGLPDWTCKKGIFPPVLQVLTCPRLQVF